MSVIIYLSQGPPLNSREVRRSQWVVATPFQSLLAGAEEVDFVSHRQYQTKQKPCLGSDRALPHSLILDEKHCQINWL